jgi:hypothetical protein
MERNFLSGLPFIRLHGAQLVPPTPGGEACATAKLHTIGSFAVFFPGKRQALRTNSLQANLIRKPSSHSG